MRIAIAAAGTGGHLYPGLEIAHALVRAGVNHDDVTFFGGDGMEHEIVTKAGFELVPFRLAKLRRSLTIENLKIPTIVRKAARSMASEIEERRIDVMLGMSGYVTVPAAMAAKRVGLPLALHEQNASPGLAARFAARRAQAVFIGLPGKSEGLKGAELIGNPIRLGLAAFDRTALRAAARSRYGLTAPGPVIGVLGGSLGARVLNESVPRMMAALGKGSVVHLTGRAAHSDMTRLAEGAPLPWRCLAFEDRMEDFFSAVDLVVSRAGAMTVSELAATATPAVLVPLERVGQQHNAAGLISAGGAVGVRQRHIDQLPATVKSLISNPDRLETMARASAREARPDAASRIASRLLELSGG